MPKNRIILVLGLLVAVMHALDGLPQVWESFLGILFGLSIVLLSVWSTIDRKLSLKAKAQMRQRKVVEPAPAQAAPVVEEEPHHGKRVTDFYPKTGQPGRRLSDIKPTDFNTLN